MRVLSSLYSIKVLFRWTYSEKNAFLFQKGGFVVASNEDLLENPDGKKKWKSDTKKAI